VRHVLIFTMKGLNTDRLPFTTRDQKPRVIFLISFLVAVVVFWLYFYIPRLVHAPSFVYDDEAVVKQQRLYTETALKLPESLAQKNVVLIAVGDSMLSRVVGQKMRAYNDYRYPFLKTGAFLRDADITFGNLETAVFPGPPIKTGEMLFRADTESLEGLIFAGFDLVSLANNHTPNFGTEGLQKTFAYLQESEIGFVGAGESEYSARAPYIIERNGITFGFLAYNDERVVPQSYAAQDGHAGTAFMDSLKMTEDVSVLKNSVDFVIVSMHAGVEYTYTHSTRQKEFAHDAIDAGAALVIGHHPHWVQRMEKYKNGYIIYSLGNFVFDQMWSQETREGAIAIITFSQKEIELIDFKTVIIEDYSQPRFTTDEEHARIMSHILIKE